MNIHIEFCEKWNYRPDFDRVSKLIKKIAPTAKIEGNTKPPRSGAFEVSFDKKMVYSKFKTGEFPQEGDIKSWVWGIRGRLINCPKSPKLPPYLYWCISRFHFNNL